MASRRLALALAVLIAIPIGWSWWGSDRRQIGRQVDRLQDLVSKSGNESALEGLASARAITNLFASSFEVRAEQLRFSTHDRQELIRFIHHYRSTSEAIDMRVTNTSLSLAPEHGRATLVADFEFLSGGPLSSSPERYRVQVNWLLEEGRWLIDWVNVVEIIAAGIPGGDANPGR